MTGVIIPGDVLESIELPKHLLMRIALLDDDGNVVRAGRSVQHLVATSSSQPQAGRSPELLKNSGNKKAQKPSETGSLAVSSSNWNASRQVINCDFFKACS